MGTLRRMGWIGYVECREEKGNAHAVMVTRRGGKRQAGESKHRNEDNIKMNFKELFCSALDWINIERVCRLLTTQQSPSHLISLIVLVVKPWPPQRQEGGAMPWPIFTPT
jgi:hypothetical protein